VRGADRHADHVGHAAPPSSPHHLEAEREQQRDHHDRQQAGADRTVEQEGHGLFI